MIFPKDEGVGDWKRGKKFEMGRAPFLEKCFKIFLGKKTPKMTTFPSCGSVSPSLTILEWKNVLGKPILHSRSRRKAKRILSMNLSGISPVWRSRSFTFWVFPMYIFLSHVFLMSASCFPEHDCPEFDFVSLI